VTGGEEAERSGHGDRRRVSGSLLDAWLVGAGLFALQFGLICGNPIVILTFVSAHFCSLSNEF
jgi:hypothetical protein